MHPPGGSRFSPCRSLKTVPSNDRIWDEWRWWIVLVMLTMLVSHSFREEREMSGRSEW